MEFTFLGTSAGTPTKSRNVTGLALSHGGPKHWYLIDCGEGAQHQLLRTHHSVMQLQAIFETSSNVMCVNYYPVNYLQVPMLFHNRLTVLLLQLEFEG